MKMLAGFLLMTNLLFATSIIKIEQLEPLSFKKDIKKLEFDNDGKKVIATGQLEIFIPEDKQELVPEQYQRLIKIKLPSKFYITNQNNHVAVEDLKIADKFENENGIIFHGKRRVVDIVGTIDREGTDLLEENADGEYKGDIPMEVYIYKKTGGAK